MYKQHIKILGVIQMKKIISALLIAILTVAPITIHAANPNLSDINGHWAEYKIKQLVAFKVVDGYPDGTFKPDNSITRGEFAKIMRTAVELDQERGTAFADTATYWGKDDIYTLVKENIINTDEYGAKFGADTNITRIEIAKMIIRGLGYEEDAKDLEGEATDFIDDNMIEDADKGYIILATENNIIAGYEDGSFKPNGEATRAEAVKMVVNMLDLTNFKIPTAENEMETNEVYQAKVDNALADGTITDDEEDQLYDVSIEDWVNAIAQYNSSTESFPKPIIKVYHDYTSISSQLYMIVLENINEYNDNFTFQTIVTTDERLNRYDGLNSQRKWITTRMDTVENFDLIHNHRGVLTVLDSHFYCLHSERDTFKLYDGMKIDYKIIITNTATGESKTYDKAVTIRTLKYKEG